jgi:hypothetical protein
VRRGSSLILVVGLVLGLSACGGSSGQTDAQKRAILARAEREMNTTAYDDALKEIRGLGNWDDAPKVLLKDRKRAARETLANAESKNLKKAPRAAMSLTKTSIKYWDTPEARRFLKKATKAHAEFKKKRQAAGHF